MKAKVVDYSPKAIAVFGAESSAEKAMLENNGMFNTSLKYNGTDERRPGWIFSAKRRADVEKLAKKFSMETVDYSDRAVALFGETEAHVKAFLAAKGIFNARLKDEKGQTCPGWIFPKTKETQVVELLKSLS